jgi:hypothetical protein
MVNPIRLLGSAGRSRRDFKFVAAPSALERNAVGWMSLHAPSHLLGVPLGLSIFGEQALGVLAMTHSSAGSWLAPLDGVLRPQLESDRRRSFL